MELPRQRRARKNKYDKNLYPLGIIDIIETDYPDRYFNLSENLETLFSREEWVDILTRSRVSYEPLIKLKKTRNQKHK
ncbi:hypothetical protein [Desulfosporosinus sp.]|uniref:hypothetical protein n=1 Tax=Desulfosporosinus sp. TaxID=157907 RepID=UPI00261F2606|nr:hypothetical protein [Desulfosporosinus sp.]